jgi:hypothetical protein
VDEVDENNVQPISVAGPLADPHAEALRLLDAAAATSVPLRITGGVAIAMRCPSTSRPPLQRDYVDIDAVGLRRDRAAVVRVMRSSGYLADEEFNGLHGDSRLYFWDATNDRHVDVFLDEVQMCHTITLRDRIAMHDRTLSLADLLLLKLQIVETNRKDYLDIFALLVDQPFTEDESGINLAYITQLASADWGLWRTTTIVAERAEHFAAELEGFGERGRVRDQVKTYLAALESSPKTRGWKMRAKLGDRKRWYELPEEVR